VMIPPCLTLGGANLKKRLNQLAPGPKTLSRESREYTIRTIVSRRRFRIAASTDGAYLRS